MHFGRQVKARRLELGLTQQALATRARLSQTTIADIERGRNVGSRHLLALAEALEMPPNALGDKAPRAQEPTPVYAFDLRYDRAAWRALPMERRAQIEFLLSGLIAGTIEPALNEPPMRRRRRSPMQHAVATARTRTAQRSR